ncbi:HIT family protein [Candidatus Marsarchaeota archaeon]|nr:HIT family protein [Candidatus Marsarchaeota archaeon]MCL5404504.1 HIT family protein [Candidatus Marsarchaeota archaeon]
MNANCVFCGIVSKRHDILYEGELCFVMPSKYPVSLGHVLVIPKAHYKDIYKMPVPVLSEMLKLTNAFNNIASKKLKAIGVKDIANNGASAGQTVFHAHMHIIPVYGKIGMYAIGKHAVSNGEMPPSMEKAYERIAKAADSLKL